MLRVAVWLTLVCAVGAFAQTPDTATVQGQVTDPSHAVVPGVHLTVKNVRIGLTRSVKTDDSGKFSVAGLPVGSYNISASKQGFAEAHLDNLNLVGGTTASVNLQLSVAGGETQVNVTGVAGEVRTDEPQLGTHLSEKQMEETPLLNRKITYLPLLNAANRPAINQGDIFINQNLFTTNGAGRSQTWFEVDGTTGNDSWGRQTIFSTLPLFAVQELEVLVNGFSAEYGGSTGSAVNIVSKSGSNQFHGEVLELWRPSGTEAALSGFTTTNAASGNDITSDTLGQSAVSLGGPVDSGGRTHFFVAGEFSRQDRASPIISPVAPGSFVGHYRGWLGFLRLDHQINDRNNLFFRSNV